MPVAAWIAIAAVAAATLIAASVTVGALLANAGRTTDPSASNPNIVSAPAAIGTMPNYFGWNVGAAAYDLRRFGVSLSLTAEQSASVVGSQTPIQGTSLYTGTSVILYTYRTATPAAPPSVPVAASNPGGPLGAGTYAVGTDITAGTWHTNGGTRCHYERDRDTNGTISSIIANDNFSGPTTITVAASDAVLKLSGDCSWTRR